MEEVIAFRMAPEALAYLRWTDHAPADVIPLDVNMPQMNVFEFLERAVAEFAPASSAAWW